MLVLFVCLSVWLVGYLLVRLFLYYLVVCLFVFLCFCCGCLVQGRGF